MDQIFKIIAYTRKFWKWYLGMGLFVMAVSALSLAVPLLSKQVVDIVVKQFSGQTQNISSLLRIFVFIIAIDIATTVLTASGQWFGDRMAVQLQTFLSSKFYEHLLSLDIGYYDNEITGKIVNKMYRGIQSITDFINNMTNNFLPFFLSAFVTILLLAQYSLVIALLLAALFPIYILISHGSTIAWSKHEEEKNKINDISQGRVFESITGIRVVRAFVGEIAELTEFLRSRHRVENITIKQTRGWHIYDFYRRIVLNIILFAIYAYVVYWTYVGRFTLGEMTLLLQLVNQARFPLFAMSFILGQIQQANAGSKDFFDILATKSKINDSPNAADLAVDSSRDVPMIEFKRVAFEYNEHKEVLKNINFSISPGEKMALVGESGQGKSTVVNLLLRYYEPQSGVILVGGQDISQSKQASLRSLVAVVFQDSLLFSGTIMDNIRYGNPNASIAQIKEAAEAANAVEFIEKLPHGYDSVVGERGVKLSGGQKQRVAIARAILKNARIIVLDEATSSLDSKSEIQVQKGLDRLMAGRTAIIIAHRLSTIAHADNILVLAGGTVAQYGNPHELLEDKKGLYYQLVSLQQKLLKAPSDTAAKLTEFELVG